MKRAENNCDSNTGIQKQRISVTRLFLQNPLILLLDEATGARDNESRIPTEKSLTDFFIARVTQTIAHRTTTIRSADRIIVPAAKGSGDICGTESSEKKETQKYDYSQNHYNH